MDYANVIKDSLRIYWQHKILWLVGLGLALVGQAEYHFRWNSQISYTNFPSNYPMNRINPSLLDFLKDEKILDFLQVILQNSILTILVLGSILVILWGISAFWGVWGRGLGINLVGDIYHGKANSIQESVRATSQQSLTAFRLKILFKLPVLCFSLPWIMIGLAIALQFSDLLAMYLSSEGNPEVFSAASPLFYWLVLYLLCTIPLSCTSSIVNWAAELYFQVAIRSCIIENRGILGSVRRAWAVVRWGAWYLFLTEFLFTAGQWVFGMVMAIPAVGMFIPLWGKIFSLNWSLPAVTEISMLAAYVIFAQIAVGGILTGFNQTLWTRLYHEFLTDQVEVD